MDKNTYRFVSKFNYCGKTMITVIMNDSKVTCVMTELEYNRIIETERKFKKRNKLMVA